MEATGHALARIDFDSLHSGEVDHHTAIAHPVPEPAVASGTHGQPQILGLGKLEGARESGGPAHRTITPGRWSNALLKIERADSYSGASCVITWPVILEAKL